MHGAFQIFLLSGSSFPMVSGKTKELLCISSCKAKAPCLRSPVVRALESVSGKQSNVYDS